MGFRRTINRHELWAAWCAGGQDLLGDLPAEAYRTEKNFRTLVTDGALPAAGIKLADFTDSQIEALWDFVHYRTEFDMDASKFDALNTRFRAIRENRTLSARNRRMPPN